MSLAFNRSLNPQIARNKPLSLDEESRLNISVIFTSVVATIAALKRAGSLAESLGGQITLVVPQIVPYPLPLASPPVFLEFQERRFLELAKESPVEIQVQLYLCRDPLDGLKAALEPESLLVVGGRKHWWPTREKRLARQLHRAGHEVIFNEID